MLMEKNVTPEYCFHRKWHVAVK